MTVRQLLNSLDSRELIEWMAYFKIETERMEKAQKPPSMENQLGMNLTGYGKK